MSSFLALLALFLPLAALANPVSPRELSWNTTAPNTTTTSFPVLADQVRGNKIGDTLGITRCYCASEDWDQDHVMGYFYHWEYYNFHSDQTFDLEMTCTSAKMYPYHYPFPYTQFECLIERHGEKHCVHDKHKNSFCYELNSREGWDFFFYNKQKRGIPKYARKEPKERVEEICGNLCRDKLGGLNMLKGMALVNAHQRVPASDLYNWNDDEWSHVAFYPEVDDMCPGCK